MPITRVQRRRFLLSGIIALLLLAAFWWFGLGPAWEKERVLDAQLATRRKASEGLTQSLQQARKVEAEYDTVRVQLLDVMARQIPPEGNPMAWAGEVVRRAAQSAGITDEYRAINEAIAGGTRSGATVRKGRSQMLESYEVKIDLQCGYHRLGHFLANLERDVPYIGIQGLTIVPAVDTSERLRISLRCFFPRFTEEGFPPEARPDRENPKVPVRKAPVISTPVEKPGEDS